jgi:hypothetical protein
MYLVPPAGYEHTAYNVFHAQTGKSMFDISGDSPGGDFPLLATDHTQVYFDNGYIYETTTEAHDASQMAHIAPTSPYAIVYNGMESLNAYAAESFAITKTYINTINSFVTDLVVPDPGDIDDVTISISPIDYGVRPDFTETLAITGGWPTNNATMTWATLPTITIPAFPTFNIADPSYVTVPAPSITDIPFTATLAVINPVALPAVPTVTLPSVPTFSDINIPAAPTTTIPAFTATLPAENITSPTPFSCAPTSYVSEIWSDLLARVLHDITNGGTGMLQAEEDALYQRFLDKTFVENGRLYDEASNYWAARGFTLPPGMLTSAINEINMQISRNNMLASREITINQAELRVKHNDFIIETGAKLEGMIREFYEKNAVMAMEAAKAVANNGLSIHEAMIKRHELSLEAYKSEAVVYESVVKAALVEVEVFKGQVEGARVSAEVQKSLVEVYTAQVGAAETLMKLYVSEMEGAKIASEIELTKIEQFKALTQAYIARMEGEKSKVDLYEARLRGEALKAEAYKAQVQAFEVEVEAHSKSLDAHLKELEVVMRQNTASVEKYKAELSAYDAEVRAKSSQVGAVVSAFEAEVHAYAAENGASEAYYRAKIEEIRAQVSVADFNLKKAVSEIEAATSGYKAIKELQLKGTEGIMNVGAQLTASALNAANVSASIGGTSSDSRTSSTSKSTETRYNYDMTGVD